MSPLPKRIGTAAMLALAALFCTNPCNLWAQDKGGSVGDSDADALVRLRKEIIDLIGDPVCTNLVYCRVLALGVKPCGKPDEYLAYSATAKTNPDTLSARAAEYAFLQEEAQMASQPTSACVLPRLPRVQCLDQRCKLRPQ